MGSSVVSVVTAKDLLKSGIEYGLWANRQWLAYLDQSGVGEPDRAIFQHLMGAQTAWLLRCEGNPPETPPMPELTDAVLVDITERWLRLIDATDLDTWIDYKRYNGDPNRMKFAAMTQHVINHGTYHRGELRGLCRARGDESFPDTDIAVYAFVSGNAEPLS